MSPAIDPERRAALVGAKLRALVAGHGSGTEPAETLAHPAGAGLCTADGLWVLIESADAATIGGALAWAGAALRDLGRDVVDGGQVRAPDFGGGALHVVLDGEAAPRAGTIARRAALFREPPSVWRVEGRRLEQVAPTPAPVAPEPDPVALGRIDELRAAGLDVVVEHGVVRGEIDGLEVAVVKVDGEGGARIEVGVGRNDRIAFALLHGELPPAQALAQVAETVRRHRRAGVPPHPLNRMAPERWLRARLRHAGLDGWSLDPVPGTEPREGVADPGPAFAYGHDAGGAPTLLACSVGIDLELVPAAADTRAAIDPTARLVLALPERDAHPVTRRLAAALARPAEIHPVADDWRAATSL